MDGLAAASRRESGDDSADQDREKCPTFDERIAFRQLLAGEVVGQDAVLDRAEHGRDHAEKKNGEKEQDE